MKRSNLIALLVFAAVSIVSQMPLYALWPMHPDEVNRLKAEGKYDSMIQQWYDYKETNPQRYYNGNELSSRPGKIDKIKNSINRKASSEDKDIDLDTNGVVDERDFLELGYPTSRNAQSYIAPSIGTQKSIVILVDFEDRPGNPDLGTQYVKKMLFSQKEMSTPSMREYYAEVSRDQLDCVGTVADSGVNGGWFRVAGSASAYYGFDNAPYLVAEAVRLADPYIDFREFDNDGSGYVQSLIVVVGGSPRDWNTFWPHRYAVYQPFQVDGVTVYPYFLSTEDSRMGTYAHEHGHAMGLPDLYDYDSTSYGVGFWCLMGYGCYGGDQYVPVHMNAWCKSKLGWLNPVVVTTGFSSANIPGTPSTNTVFKFWPSDNHTRNEFFMVENRRKQGYDAYLPGEGLLIWHVDAWGNQDNDARRIVDLEEADGRNDIDTKANWGDDTDPFYLENGFDRFTDYTYPGAKTNFGKISNIVVTNVSIRQDIMHASLYYSPLEIGGYIHQDPESITPKH